MAARFLRDFLRYHRDLRRLEALNSALDSGNLIGNWKLRELSAMNGTLYEFLLPEEQKPSEDKVLRHVILKADIRDSSRLTRSLLEQGMNPASYFSLNFYDPVNKLLAKYGARKVFVEGDAIIVALLEHEGEAPLAVSRACVLAREIIDIVRGYNHLLERAGLPALELGTGISFQDAAPMYLMDGEQQIMISDALNESDRLSSCNKRVRKAIAGVEGPFNVYAFQTVKDADAGESPEDFILKYNLNGIRLSEAAFQRLQQEISLEPCQLGPAQIVGQRRISSCTADWCRSATRFSRRYWCAPAGSLKLIPTNSPCSTGLSAATTKSAPTRRSTPCWKAKQQRAVPSFPSCYQNLHALELKKSAIPPIARVSVIRHLHHGLCHPDCRAGVWRGAGACAWALDCRWRHRAGGSRSADRSESHSPEGFGALGRSAGRTKTSRVI